MLFTVPNPKFVLAVPAFVRSDKLLAFTSNAFNAAVVVAASAFVAIARFVALILASVLLLIAYGLNIADVSAILTFIANLFAMVAVSAFNAIILVR